MRTAFVLPLAVLLAMVSLSACARRFSDETPPANAKPLSEIIKSLEDQGYTSIGRIKFDDNAWVIEVHQAGGREVELLVNPVSGQIMKTE
jgi:hypothetical protein